MTHAKFASIINHAMQQTSMTEAQILAHIFSIRATEMPVINAASLYTLKKIKYVNSGFEGFIINDYSSPESSVQTGVITQFIPIESVMSISFDFNRVIPEPDVNETEV